MSDKQDVSSHRVPANIVVIAVVTAVVAVVSDQLTKWWALNNLEPGQDYPVLGDLFSFRLVHNPGAAFSLGDGNTIVFSFLSLAVVIGIVWWFVSGRVRTKALAFLVALVGGGAVGNLIDRLVQPPSFGRGHVVDFLSYNGWFVGNVADIWIVGGTLAAVIYVFIKGDFSSSAKESVD